MKKIFLVLFLYVSAICPKNENFSLMTWNVLGLFAPDIEAHGFKRGDLSRFQRTAAIIKKYKPDILCMQETGQAVLDYFEGRDAKKLDSGLSKQYQLVTAALKNIPGKKHIPTSGTALFLKKGSKLQVVDHGAIPHGFSVAAWAVLKQQETQQLILVTTVHISRGSKRDNQEQGEEEWSAILSKLKPALRKYKDALLIFAGDFNVLYEEAVDTLGGTIAYLSKTLDRSLEIYHHNSWTESRALGSFDRNTWRYTAYTNPDGSFTGHEFSSIDHIVFSHSNALQLLGSRSWVGSPKNQYKNGLVQGAQDNVELSDTPVFSKVPSDHLPIYVTFKVQHAQEAAVHSLLYSLSELEKAVLNRLTN